jgi:hypothetical protein|tara:strand:- start:477 stop:1367 length:891 start_codon:yes stop_codon:yes gene_type:complete
MIKLFWNTHNKATPTSDKPNEEKVTTDYGWGIYHKNNSDKWIYDILLKIQFDIIQSEKELESNDTLIIVDSDIERKNKLYIKLKLICSKIFLIHLGDESGIYDLSSIYNNFNFVWRTFCSNKYFKNKQVSCLPIGYKSGTFFEKQEIERKYKWAFIGTPHKSSRHDLLFQLSTIKPSYCYKTKKFNDKIMEINEMNEILSSTEFIPCPSGFVHPETYRLYESLECGCIPIVENAYKYYDRLFPNNPFLKVDKWIEAKAVIEKWGRPQIKYKRKECEVWWKQHKNQLQEFIKNKINS